MRPIDADALKEDLEIGGTKTSCKGCKYKGHWGICDLDKVPSFVAVCSAIDDAPTVEAIPISWLEERAKDWLAVPLGEYAYEIAQRQADKYLTVIERWRREQKE